MLKAETKKLQEDLALYCRNGEQISLEGANPDRLHHYRRLVYNIQYGIMSKAFPIARSIISESEFKELINQFLIHHDAQTPEVWRVPGEFYEFVRKADLAIKTDYPCLADLLYMEWMEIFVFNSPENKVKPFERRKPVQTDAVVVNPDHAILELHYPVHKGDYEHIGEKQGRYLLLIYRNLDSKKVHFTGISDLHRLLIIQLKTAEISSDKALVEIGEELNVTLSDSDTDKIHRFLEEMYDAGFICGVPAQ